jgi:hypothetical protein
MTATKTTSDRIGDTAAVVLGAAAFLASAIHVYTVCIQVAGADPSLTDRIVAVLITVAVELLAAVSMLELRRGFRLAPTFGLLLGVGLTCAANLATARQNGPGWGWPETVAIAPAVLFLVVLVIVETRPDAHPERPSESAPAVRTAAPGGLVPDPVWRSQTTTRPASADAPPPLALDASKPASADAGPLPARTKRRPPDELARRRRQQHVSPEVQAIMDELGCGRSKAAEVLRGRRRAAEAARAGG